MRVRLESNDTLGVEENVAERVRPLQIAAIRQQETLCFLKMQDMPWMSSDNIKYDNAEDVPVVKDPEFGTPLFDPRTENIDDACNVSTFLNIYFLSLDLRKITKNVINGPVISFSHIRALV